MTTTTGGDQTPGGSGTGPRSRSSAPEFSRPRRPTPPGSRRRGTRRWKGSTRPAGGPATPCRAYTSPRYRANSCARWPAPRMKREASSSGGPRWNPPRQVWSEVGEWLDKMEAFQPGSRRNQVERMDLAGSGFQRLLRVLRTVVLHRS